MNTGHEPSDKPPSIEAIMAQIERSPLGPLLRDEQAMDRMICDLMADSRNPITNEIGRELRDGNTTWQGLGDVEAYRETLLYESAQRIKDLDMKEISRELDEVTSKPPAEPSDTDNWLKDGDGRWQKPDHPRGDG